MTPPQSGLQQILQEMRTRVEATRPQLARASGLSLVTVNRLVARLCAAGEIEPVGEVSSGGGRPVQLYRLRRAASRTALLRLSRTPTGIYGCTLEVFDPLGAVLRQEEARFAHLEATTLNSWLNNSLHQRRSARHPRRLLSICIEAGSLALPPQLCAHLSERYHCPCLRLTVADALAEAREGTATLVLRPGAAPLATLYRNGERHACCRLELLPLPADWTTLDYSDHTLVEEMISRLLLTLSCTLSPESFVLYGSFWNERLQHRIRYNLSSKLRGSALPSLRFCKLTEQACLDALWRLALRPLDY